MLPASFWPQALAVSSNENKQMETIRNRRSIGITFLPLFSPLPCQLNLGSFTLILPEGMLPGYFTAEAGRLEPSGAPSVRPRAGTSADRSLAIRYPRAQI